MEVRITVKILCHGTKEKPGFIPKRREDACQRGGEESLSVKRNGNKYQKRKKALYR